MTQQAKPVYGLGGPVTVAFSPDEYTSKTQFLRRKRIAWGANKTNLQMKECIENKNMMGTDRFKTITGNNRRVIKELVRKEEKDIYIKSKAEERFFKYTNCKLAFGLPIEIQRWYADFDNKAREAIVRDTPYDRCTVSALQCVLLFMFVDAKTAFVHFDDQKLREEYLKLTNPALAIENREISNVDDLRMKYYKELLSKDANAEIELLKRAGFKLEVVGKQFRKPANWTAYKSLVIENTE